jgi:hypothetical protein
VIVREAHRGAEVGHRRPDRNTQHLATSVGQGLSTTTYTTHQREPC